MSDLLNILQFDVGNSAAKWRLVIADEVVARGSMGHGDIDRVAGELAATPPDAIWVSSVASAAVNDRLREALRQSFGVSPWFAETQARTGSLVNSYAEPEKMGVDRWLAMLAARARFPGPLCVVDVGSATTIDLVAADGRHEGGYILPGPALMERALLLDTDRVRFDDAAEYRLEPGRSTAEAVRHGIALAQIGAIEMIPDLRQRVLVVTGGGAATVSELVDRETVCVPDLVFDGLAALAAEEGIVAACG